MYCETHSMSDIRRKVAAWRELYQRPPVVALAGTWEDAARDAVFFDTHKSTPVEIHRSHVAVEVDGEVAELKPTSFSGIWLTAEPGG